MRGAGGSYGYQMLTYAAKVLEDAGRAMDIEAGKTALDGFEVLCQAVDRGRNNSRARDRSAFGVRAQSN
jgi:hypothetical protein